MTAAMYLCPREGASGTFRALAFHLELHQREERELSAAALIAQVHNVPAFCCGGVLSLGQELSATSRTRREKEPPAGIHASAVASAAENDGQLLVTYRERYSLVGGSAGSGTRRARVKTSPAAGMSAPAAAPHPAPHPPLLAPTAKGAASPSLLAPPPPPPPS